MRLPPLLFLAALAAMPPPAAAGESYDNCTGTIASLPATITTQGVWCMKSDLSTPITSGNAITVATNNVTIDCNQFKLGGLGAGPSSFTIGIFVDTRLNAVVRNCNIRGFETGVKMVAGSGHVVEDNRFDGNLHVGVNVSGTLSVIRRNLILDTGTPTPGPYTIAGVLAAGGVDVLDNTIDGAVANGSPNANAHGISYLTNSGSVVARNHVRNLLASGTGTTRGISFDHTGNAVARDNVLHGSVGTGYGIYCDAAGSLAVDNVIVDWTTAVQDCTSSGNVVN